MPAVGVFVYYPSVPKTLRNAGRQPGFGDGHILFVRRADAPYSPPWLDEFTHESGPVRDCVPVVGVRGVNYLAAGAKAPCTPAEREALQNAMGTQDRGADELALARGAYARYGIVLHHGRSWGPIVDAIGGNDVPVIVGDPLGTRDLTGYTLRDLYTASAGLQHRYVIFPDPKEVAPVWAQTVTPADHDLTVKDQAPIFSDPGDAMARFHYSRGPVHAVLQLPDWFGYPLAAGGLAWIHKSDVTNATPRATYASGYAAAKAKALAAVKGV